ncbi:hypothetical protein Mpet_0866 [Methanolacinia petrolearia DSM 11571]|uniref:Uncharacterized protein n=1 Tax=Methanolacinia petrolearia (strain DSM 11571 / OCM 486 / SEBR 4847) TaxID=679926 RepID=E1RJB8_METP4|nr:hypothetical protein [Methanolacinia petrolearia]ADN35636.1 hypothetical protein Mpet_0866 [Methanolacinia petrolearia DSM 11571]
MVIPFPNRKLAAILILSAIAVSNFCLPVMADARIATSSQVFFEKNGEPYNDSVSFTVTCYGFTYTYTDPDFRKYLSGEYEKRAPGSDNQTEVFSYSATVDHYGDEIFEPFYLNYRVIDYCSLCGETGGIEFYIDNVSGTPGSNCSYRSLPVKYRYNDDVCHMPTEQYKSCMDEQNEQQAQERKLCDQYLEKFDKKKLYPADARTLEKSGVTMVITPEYDACQERADSIDLNCSCFLEDVSCRDITDPEGTPIQRDCSLFFEIPAYENGTIIGTTIGTDTEIPVIHAEPGIVYRNNFWIELWEKFVYPLLSKNS